MDTAKHIRPRMADLWQTIKIVVAKWYHYHKARTLSKEYHRLRDKYICPLWLAEKANPNLRTYRLKSLWHMRKFNRRCRDMKRHMKKFGIEHE